MDLFQKLAMMGSSIFTGQRGSGISPEQQRAATGQGLTAAGLQTILESQPGAGPGGASPTALGAIAQGALAGQQVGGAARADFKNRNRLAGLATADLTTSEGIAAALPQFLQDPELFGELVKLQGQVAGQEETEAPDRVDLGDRFLFYDPKDPTKIVETILKTPDATEAENRLATDYARAISKYVEVAMAMGRVLSSAEAPSAAGDMSLVFAYMKILEPNSTVREGEQATAKNAGDISDRLIAFYNSALNGQSFSADVRADFVDRTRRLIKGQRPLLDQQIDHFRRRAESQNADPDLIIFDPYVPFSSFINATPGTPLSEISSFSGAAPGATPPAAPPETTTESALFFNPDGTLRRPRRPGGF